MWRRKSYAVRGCKADLQVACGLYLLLYDTQMFVQGLKLQQVTTYELESSPQSLIVRRDQ
jgi:hypothetical protein